MISYLSAYLRVSLESEIVVTLYVVTGCSFDPKMHSRLMRDSLAFHRSVLLELS